MTMQGHGTFKRSQSLVRGLQLLTLPIMFTLLLGGSYLSQFLKAITMHNKHQTIFTQFSATFPESTVKEWEDKVAAWDADPSQPNLYEEPMASKSNLQLPKSEY